MRSRALEEIAATYETLPSDTDELQTLPRVGVYVANATICFALAEPLPVVDRNVVRVYRRVFGAEFPESANERVHFAESILPELGEEARTYNLALLDFGAMVCTKLEPDCESCFANDYCVYYGEETGSE
ncbi:hypothetical protein [Haloplanus salinarum]|uniref:hypothetical protein n=1 Tax=Haloplanus salinarum TaxID=1912324 RepID=UPI00214CA77B|nr:hypothetical protein [Haloplanus salinarum]